MVCNFSRQNHGKQFLSSPLIIASHDEKDKNVLRSQGRGRPLRAGSSKGKYG